MFRPLLESRKCVGLCGEQFGPVSCWNAGTDASRAGRCIHSQMRLIAALASVCMRSSAALPIYTTTTSGQTLHFHRTLPVTVQRLLAGCCCAMQRVESTIIRVLSPNASCHGLKVGECERQAPNTKDQTVNGRPNRSPEQLPIGAPVVLKPVNNPVKYAR